jgi:hypothetical protein
MGKFWAKIPKWLKIFTPVVVVLFIIAFFAVGWYASGRVINVNLQQVAYDQTIEAVHGDTYTIAGSAYDMNGIMGGIRSDGSMVGIYSAPLSINNTTHTSIRMLSNSTNPKPHVGEKISLQGNIWTTDPKTALGIEYHNITYSDPIGPMGAWLIPSPDSTKWVIGVHGIGADKTEMLRFIKPVQAAGDTMMVINYRNDAGNPKSPDGYTHLGDTEWQDLQAAVHYAKAHGATDIRLYGDSLGGSIVENYLRRSPEVASSHISRVILDSPAINWGEILRFRAHKAGYPTFVYYPTEVTIDLRAGVNLNRISTKAKDIKQKTLIIHNADDQTVPQNASKILAAARPDLITFVDFGSGGHLRAWNHDQARYEHLITSFLSN